MKILILEPFYTNFHSELAKKLSDDISTFIFNYGNIIYLNGAKKVYVHKEIENISFTNKDLKIAKNTQTLYTETLRKIENIEPSQSDFEYMAKYISYLRKYLLDNNIELVTMHNDLRWQHSLSIEICKELGVKCLITERGIIRPDTTTIEFQGVNAYSSLPKDKEFYKNYSIHEKTLRSYKVSKFTSLKVNLKFIVFIILNKIGSIFNLNTQVKNRDYSLVKFAKLFLKQKLTKKNSLDVSLPKKYLFVPLQVNTDTQLLIHSDFQDMQEFICKVEKEFYSLDTGMGLVFKRHPMEQGMVEYKFDTRSIVVNSDTNELVQNSECVITINSTVGFEAIQKYKLVIVLGEAFFKIDGIAVCSSKDSFKDDMQNVLDGNIELDNEAIEAFVKYLKFEYQVNGSLFNWSDETFDEINNKKGLIK